MALTRLLGSKSARFLTAFTLAVEAKREFDRGRKARAAALLVVAALSWQWAALGLVAQGVLSVIRGRRARVRA